MDNPHFIQKTALITGGCGGLGRSIAEAFLRAGTNVVVCDINEGLMSDFKEKVSSAYPECTLVLQADITKDGRVEEVFAEGEKMFGNIDFVINSAGRIDRFDAVAEMERQMWDKVIALNLTAEVAHGQRLSISGLPVLTCLPQVLRIPRVSMVSLA